MTHSKLGTSSKELDSLISAQPRTKEDFIDLANKITQFIVKRHMDKPLYPAFVEHFVRELAMPLKDVEVRKAASGLTTLANEKQREQRDKSGGKKKKGSAKPALGAAKVGGKYVFLSLHLKFAVDRDVSSGWIPVYMTKPSMTSAPTQTISCRQYTCIVAINVQRHLLITHMSLEHLRGVG